MDVTKAASIAALILSTGGVAYSSGHLTSRVDAIEHSDKVTQEKLSKYGLAQTELQIQLATIQRDILWIRKTMEGKELYEDPVSTNDR